MRIAVIGAGPAGSRAAARLAHAGHDVTLFDRSFDREKPCGGGVTWRALELLLRPADSRLTIAARSAGQRSIRTDRATIAPEAECIPPVAEWIAPEAEWIAPEAECIAPEAECIAPGAAIRRVVFEGASGAAAVVALPRPIGIFSRRALDAALAREAEASGASLVRDGVISIEREGDRFALSLAGGGAARFDHVIGADGARSLVRRTFSASFDRADLSQAVGWYVPGHTSDTTTIRFDPRIDGYLWIFPRPDHLAIGACAPLEPGGAETLWGAARDLLASRGHSEHGQARYSALIPSLSPAALEANRVCGLGWSLVGDASGCVDPLTREGIAPAIRSADLLAEAFERGNPESYSAAWRGAFLMELSWAASRRTRFFDPVLTDRLVRYLACSRAVRAVMADLILGRQDYGSLKRRLVRSSLRASLEIGLSRLRAPFGILHQGLRAADHDA